MITVATIIEGLIANQRSSSQLILRRTDGFSATAEFTQNEYGYTARGTTNLGGGNSTRQTNEFNILGGSYLTVADSGGDAAFTILEPSTEFNIATATTDTSLHTAPSIFTGTYTTDVTYHDATSSTYEDGTSTLTTHYTSARSETDTTMAGSVVGTFVDRTVVYAVEGFTTRGDPYYHHGLVVVDDFLSDGWLVTSAGFTAFTNGARKLFAGETIDTGIATISTPFSYRVNTDTDLDPVGTEFLGFTQSQQVTSERTFQLETAHQLILGDFTLSPPDTTFTATLNGVITNVVSSYTGDFFTYLAEESTITNDQVALLGLSSYSNNWLFADSVTPIILTTAEFAVNRPRTTVNLEAALWPAVVNAFTNAITTRLDVEGLIVSIDQTRFIFSTFTPVPAGVEPIEGQGFVGFGLGGQWSTNYRHLEVNLPTVFEDKYFVLNEDITAIAVPPNLNAFITHRESFTLNWSHISDTAETGVATAEWVTTIQTNLPSGTGFTFVETSLSSITGARATWLVSVETTTIDGVPFTLVDKVTIRLASSENADARLKGFSMVEAGSILPIGGYSPWDDDDAFRNLSPGAYEQSTYQADGDAFISQQMYANPEIAAVPDSEMVAYRGKPTIVAVPSKSLVSPLIIDTPRYYQNQNPISQQD